ncbi:MAG: sugar ABC transporter substrate-binding protein [Actinomycetota bacterium]
MDRKLARHVAVLALAAILAACSSTRTESVRLQIFGDPQEAEAYRTLISAFEKDHAGTRVQLVVVGSQKDHMAKLATGFTAGNPPDLFLLNYRRFGQFAAKGVLEPLGDLLTKQMRPGLAEFYPPAVDAFRFSGRVVCLPQNISTPVVYYNTALFAREGIAPPSPGWDWDEMREKAQVLTADTNNDGRVDEHGLGFEPNLNRVAPFVWQAGGEIVDDLEHPTQMSLLDPPALEALKFLANLQHGDRVMPTLAEVESEDIESRFANGKLAMMIDSRRATTALRQVKGLEWDVAPLPVHPKVRRAAVMLHSDAYCMARASDHQDAAFAFVRFALGIQGATIMARTGRTVPSLRAVAESEAFLDPSQPPASARAFLDQIPVMRRSPNIAVWHEIESKADPVIEEWFYATEPPEFLGLEIDVATLDLLQPKPD